MGEIHPQAREYFKNHPDAAEIVRPFRTGFSVTRAFLERRGPAEASAFYLKPEKFMAEFLGIEREILLVHSGHREFQARTIQLHDDIVARDRVRLDPIGTVIVSPDERVMEVVNEVLMREPDRTPIIGLPEANVARLRDADSVRALFIDAFFKRDLFAQESPLKRDTYFFGRQDMVTELTDRFRSGQNSGLFGLRRIGKTSVLYAIGRRCETASLGGYLYVDLNNPALYTGRWWDLLASLIKMFAQALGDKKIRQLGLVALSTSYEEGTGAASFRSDIDVLRRRYRKNRILLALDEIENITFDISPARHWAEDFLPFWQTLRAVHQDTKGDFCFIVAGVNPHALEADRIDKFDNPLFSTARSYYLRPFDASTVREMVRRLGRYMGLRGEEPLYRRLADEYGGHPFLVRQACSHMASRLATRPAQFTTELFSSEKAAISVKLDKNVRQILNVLATWYPEEYELMRLLADGETDSFREFAEASPEFTQHVEGYGLVREARRDPAITISIVRNHLRRTSARLRVEEPSIEQYDDVLAEIGRRRNAIEKRLRELVRDGLRFKFGPRAAHEALKCFPEKRASTLISYSFEVMWEYTYFNELASVVDQHWDAFQNWFAEDKGDILKWLDQINRMRADAHMRAISEEDLAYLRVCFKRLEDKLIPSSSEV